MSHEFSFGLTRRALLGSAAFMGLGMMAGRSFAQEFASASDLPAPDGPMRWLDSGDTKGVFMKEYLPKYGAARGIEVVYDGLPWKEIGSVLPLGIRNGSAPDAFNLPFNMEPSVAISEGWLQPIDDFVPDFENWKKGYPDGAFVEGINVFGGKTYGYPFSTERRYNNALLFNRDMMNEAGYDHINEERSLTFDEMRDAAKKITDNSGGRSFGFIIGGAQVPRWGNVSTAFAQRAGAPVGASGMLEGLNLKTGMYDFGGDEYVNGIELLLAMNADGSVFPGALTIIAPQAREFITQGAAGMIIQGPWNIPTWEAKAPDFNFGMTQAPAPDEASLQNPVWRQQLPNVTNMMWLNAKANNPAYVGEFFHWLGTLEGQVAYANVGSCADPAIFPQTVELADLSARAVTMLQMAEKHVRISPNPFVRNPELSKVAAAYVAPTPGLAEAVQGLFAGQLTGVKETMTKVSDAANKAIDDAIAEAKAGGANVSRDDFAFPDWETGRDFGPADYAKL